MSGFHEVRFPDNIAYGATGGPEFATTVVATGAGHEKRNVNWAQARVVGQFEHLPIAAGSHRQACHAILGACQRDRKGRSGPLT
jgi:uncharacterized protein (TIGR02217 family)